jgi:cytidine deaminase
VITAAQRSALVKAARAVRARAHAPYSKYRVGAAVLDERGRIHAGCNVENASYGLTVCAERNAVAAAVAAGAKRIRAVAVFTEDVGTPCGACRQVLMELGGPATHVVLAAPKGGAVNRTLGQLLPEAFSFRKRT